MLEPEHVEHTANCALCLWRGPIEEVMAHLRVEHDFQGEPETWPDGGYVVVDMTLEPDDFNA